MPTNLYPTASTSAVVLPSSALITDVDTADYPLPFGIYTSDEFKQGCIDQVAYVYRKMGAAVLDVEITKYDVFSAYEDAVLEYSYLVNLHQAKNSLQSALGSATGSFDSDGELSGSDNPDAINGAQMKYPRYNFGYVRNVAAAFSGESGVGGHDTVFSASIDLETNVQDYDLQQRLQENPTFSGSIDGKKVLIKKVYYKSGRAFWSLYGIYGGLNVVGNFLNFNSYSSDTTYEVVPVWEMKQRVMDLEDRMWTRASHYSYELRNNKIRIFPTPTSDSPTKLYFEFIIPEDGPWSEPSGSSHSSSGVNGVNNINTLPFANIPFENINAIGKQFIRKYALESCKETLGYVRGKFNSIPIPNENVTMNGPDLVSNAKEAKEKLKEDLLKILEETDYAALSKKESEMTDDVGNILEKIPLGIFVG